MPIKEPTVRSTSKNARRARKRLPADTPVVTVRVDDHRDGTVHALFASPDGKQWKAYAYWPEPEQETPGIPIHWEADGSIVLDGVVVSGPPDHVDPLGVEEVPSLDRGPDDHPVEDGGEHRTLTLEP